MKVTTTVLAVFCTLSSPVFADELCDGLLQLEKEVNEKMPQKVDEATEIIQVRVNCDNKSVAYVKRILVDTTLLADGWQERKQRQHTQLHCNQSGMSRANDLTAMDIVYSKDMDYLLTLTTTPGDCE